MAEDFVRVAEAADLPPGVLLQAKAGDEVLCLANVDGQIFAVDNRCPHAGWALAFGSLEDDTIVCAGHEMSFNLPNHTLDGNPLAPERVHRYQVKVEDGGIWVGDTK